MTLISNLINMLQEVCDLTGLHQANVSRHLQFMKDADVVACQRAGVWRYYRVIDTELLELCTQRSQQLLNKQKAGS